MIQMPRRSVTRFFIPLIDVLTLLFCIFLLMPLVKGSDEDGGTATTPQEEIDRLRAEVARLKGERDDTPDQLRKELEQLRQEKMQVLQERLAVRVLEIDATTGNLYYNDPERTEIANEAQALALINRDRAAVGEGRRELYYLILYPRERSVHPLASERRRYDAWFKEVPHGWDIPGAPLKGGTP